MAQAALRSLDSPSLPAGRSRSSAVARQRIALADGASTTVHVAAFALDAVELRVALVRRRTLAAYCASAGVTDAIVGGFFTRPDCTPLGELRTRGMRRASVAFDAPWDRERSCLHVAGGVATIAPRHELPDAPRGDLLQAGPLLVRDGAPVFDRRADPEGFSAGARQFDSDITAERHPRAAIGLTEELVLAVVCDGRSRADAGLTLEELAELLAALGARTALNLDGGGSTTLIAGGRLRNRPRAGFNEPEPGGRAVATALVFQPR
jgi:hypothetical protein